MRRVIEVRETIFDSRLVENIYATEKLIKNIISRIEFTNELNYDDYKFIDIVMEKCKTGLEKAYEVMKM